MQLLYRSANSLLSLLTWHFSIGNYITRLSLPDVFVPALIVVYVIAYILCHHGRASSRTEISYSTRNIFLIKLAEAKQNRVSL